MEIHQLRYFLAVADHGGMRQAARACHVTQPTLSKQVQKLEAELGHRLFDRAPGAPRLAGSAGGGGATRLTDAGRALLPRARRIVTEWTATLESVRADVEAGRGGLRLGAIPTIAPFLLPAVVRRFRRRYPDAELTIHEDVTEHLLEEVVVGRLDLALMSLPLSDPRVDHETLFEEPLLACVAHDDPLAKRRAVRPSDLSQRPPITLHGIHCLGQRVQAYCEAIGLGEQPTGMWRASQLATVQEWVALGLGISILPRMVAERDRSSQRVYLPLGQPQPTRAVVAVFARGRSRPTLAAPLLELLRTANPGS